MLGTCCALCRVSSHPSAPAATKWKISQLPTWNACVPWTLLWQTWLSNTSPRSPSNLTMTLQHQPSAGPLGGHLRSPCSGLSPFSLPTSSCSLSSTVPQACTDVALLCLCTGCSLCLCGLSLSFSNRTSPQRSTQLSLFLGIHLEIDHSLHLSSS